MEKKTTIGHYHQHVDNGGLSVSVIAVEDDGEYVGCILEFSDGYHGYSEHSLQFYRATPKSLREMSEVLLIAANNLDAIIKKSEESF